MSLPPPDTTPNASTSEPYLICQQKPHNPCDVDKLMVEVTGGKVGSTEDVTKKLEITSSHRRREHVRLRDRELRRMLRQDYDLIIDTIADADAPTFPAPRKTARIKGRAYYHGRSCSTQSHAELVLEPLGKAPELDPETEVVVKSPGASSLEMPEHAFYAKKSFIDRDANQASDNPFDEVSNVFGIITMLWDMKSYRTVELVARSCGIRSKEDTQAPNLNLRAAVRVFRRSKLTVGIAIPALGSFERVQARTRYLDGKDERDAYSRVSSAGNVVYNDQTKQTIEGNGSFVAQGERQVLGDVTRHELTGDIVDGQTTTTGYGSMTRADGAETVSTMGIVTREDVAKRLAEAQGFEVVLTHNGTEVKVVDAIKRLGKLIEEIGKAITDIQNIFNSAPQLGWKFTFNVSVFSGSILLEWFPEDIEAVQANGRYLAVQWKLQGTIQIEVFSISVSASFGIDARAAGTGIVVKIEGSLSGKASIAAQIHLDLFKPRQEYNVATEVNAALRVVGEATIFGKTLADAELKGTGGIELVDGVLDVDWAARTCDLRGRIESKPVMVTGYVRSFWGWKNEIDPIEVMERKRLYEFK